MSLICSYEFSIVGIFKIAFFLFLPQTKSAEAEDCVFPRAPVSPSSLGDDHLRANLVEPFPQV